MRGGWREVALGDVVTLRRGHDLPSQKRVEGQYPIFSSSGIAGYHNEYKAETNGVVTGRYGTIGEVFYSTERFWPLNTTLYVDDFKSNHPRFVYYLVKTLDFAAYSDKSAVPGINRNHIHLHTVNLPPLAIQRAMAATLSCLDDKIELNNKICANLEAQAQAIFKSWFALPEAETWDYGTLSDIAEINPKRPLSKGTMATFVEMSNLPTSGSFPLDWTKREYVAGGMKFQNGDTLLARITPCLENGKTAYINFLADQEVAFGSTEYIVMCAKEGYPNELLYFLARDTEFVSFAVQNMSGSSGRQRVAGEVIANYQMLIPPKAFVDTYSQLFVSIMNTIRSHSFESRTLAALRDALLPRLMSGEIEVPMEVDYGCY